PGHCAERRRALRFGAPHSADPGRTPKERPMPAMKLSPRSLPALAGLAAMLAGCSGDSMPGGSGSVTSGITFHKDVEPLLPQHCQGCHSPGHIAPFALTTYQEARGASGLMVLQTKARTMPPWGAFSTADCTPRFGWKDDVRLTDDEIAV